MVTQAEILTFLSENKSGFRSKFKVTKLGLFGSFARNEQGEQSDIDILVEFEPNTPNLFEKKGLLKDMLRQKFGREVDICREKYIKTVFREQILTQTIYV